MDRSTIVIAAAIALALIRPDRSVRMVHARPVVLTADEQAAVENWYPGAGSAGLEWVGFYGA